MVGGECAVSLEVVQVQQWGDMGWQHAAAGGSRWIFTVVWICLHPLCRTQQAPVSIRWHHMRPLESHEVTFQHRGAAALSTAYCKAGGDSLEDCTIRAPGSTHRSLCLPLPACCCTTQCLADEPQPQVVPDWLPVLDSQAHDRGVGPPSSGNVPGHLRGCGGSQ